MLIEDGSSECEQFNGICQCYRVASGDNDII